MDQFLCICRQNGSSITWLKASPEEMVEDGTQSKQSTDQLKIHTQMVYIQGNLDDSTTLSKGIWCSPAPATGMRSLKFPWGLIAQLSRWMHFLPNLTVVITPTCWKKRPYSCELSSGHTCSMEHKHTHHMHTHCDELKMLCEFFSVAPRVWVMFLSGILVFSCYSVSTD